MRTLEEDSKTFDGDGLRYSASRFFRREAQKAERMEAAGTVVAKPAIDAYWPTLTEIVEASRPKTRDRHHNKAWAMLKGIDSRTLALRLLVAGYSACRTIDAVDYTRPNICEAIGRSLGRRRGKTAIQVGALGVDLLRQLPIFALHDDDVLFLTDVMDAEVGGAVADAMRANPYLLPLPYRPVPWTGVQTGVTPPDHWARPLLVDRGAKVENVIRKAIGIGQMQRVLDAVVALQDVQFVINEPVLDFLLTENAPDGPPQPSEPWLQDQWATNVNTIRDLWSFDLLLGEMLAARGSFTLPQHLDFRGRVYGIPHFNYQRQDYVRALFLFKHGEPIGDCGIKWLKAHTAARFDGNTWSGDKKPSRGNLSERVAWADKHLDRLRQIGDAIRNGEALAPDDLPGRDDDRYQAAAAAAELAQAWDNPEFVTGLPLTYDATCSGLQHLCALTRAPECRYANLTGDDEAYDFYVIVAREAYKTCSDIMEGPEDRKLVKGAVMTWFYGSRVGGFAAKGRPTKGQLLDAIDWGTKKKKFGAQGMTEKIVEVLKERGQSYAGAQKLAKAIDAAIRDLIPGAVEVREFLEDMVREYNKAGKQFRWETPLGMPILNCYLDPDIRTITTVIDGNRHETNWVVGDTDRIQPRKAVQGVSPNFVHSIDATHLHMVALAAKAEAIEVACVHDCFATIAPLAIRLNQIIREQFVLVHKHNWLEAVLDRARRDPLLKNMKLPTLPKMGDIMIQPSEHAYK